MRGRKGSVLFSTRESNSSFLAQDPQPHRTHSQHGVLVVCKTLPHAHHALARHGRGGRAWVFSWPTQATCRCNDAPEPRQQAGLWRITADYGGAAPGI